MRAFSVRFLAITSGILSGQIGCGPVATSEATDEATASIDDATTSATGSTSPPDLGVSAIVCGEADANVIGNEAISALAGCERLRGSIVLRYPGGDDLTPLTSLRVINESLTSAGNEDIRTLTGLESLEWVEDLALSRGGFVDLVALKNLTDIGNLLFLWTQREIVDLHGLDALKSVGGNCAVKHNYKLATLDGLGSLEWIGGDLEVVGNVELVSLSGLSALRQVDGDVHIILNAKLPQSEIDALLDRIEIGGEVFLDE